MVDIPLLRKRAAELTAGTLSRDGGAICLNAALDEIEELRAENKSVRENFALLRDTMQDRADRHAIALKNLRERFDKTSDVAIAALEYAQKRTPERYDAMMEQVRLYNSYTTATTDAPPKDNCPDCGIGPCAADPTAVTAATPRCFRPGYCGEPGGMSRPRVDCLVDGQPYPLWDEVQMRVGEGGER